MDIWSRHQSRDSWQSINGNSHNENWSENCCIHKCVASARERERDRLRPLVRLFLNFIFGQMSSIESCQVMKFTYKIFRDPIPFDSCAIIQWKMLCGGRTNERVMCGVSLCQSLIWPLILRRARESSWSIDRLKRKIHSKLPADKKFVCLASTTWLFPLAIRSGHSSAWKWFQGR